MRDWLLEVGIVSHWYPSLPDPRHMPIDEFESLLAAAPRVAKAVADNWSALG